jgi:hypothetical protein
LDYPARFPKPCRYDLIIEIPTRSKKDLAGNQNIICFPVA